MKKSIWGRLGPYSGGFWKGFWKVLEPLGASWAVLGAVFFMLVFGMVFKSALGGIRPGF